MRESARTQDRFWSGLTMRSIHAEVSESTAWAKLNDASFPCLRSSESAGGDGQANFARTGLPDNGPWG